MQAPNNESMDSNVVTTISLMANILNLESHGQEMAMKRVEIWEKLTARGRRNSATPRSPTSNRGKMSRMLPSLPRQSE